MSPRTVQTDPANQTGHGGRTDQPGEPGGAATDPPAVPIQAAPGATTAPAVELPRVVDHVRTHGRACWWDFVECRWVCEKD